MTRLRAFMLLLGFAHFTTPAIAEYRLSAGDTLEFAVIGMPELKQRVLIDLSGEISVPVLGELTATGLTLAELRAKLRERIPTRTITSRGADGRERVGVIAAGDVMLSVAEYRPIYVKGYVAHPGEQAYRPGMTVRQAMSVAGGSGLATADFSQEYNSLWIAYAKDLALIARLDAELAGASSLDAKKLADIPIAPQLAARIRDLESDVLAARQTEREREGTYVDRALAILAERTDVLTAQQSKEEEGALQDVAEAARVDDLLRRNLVPSSRAQEARRLSLLSSTRALQVGVELEKLKREKLELSRSLERLDERKRVELRIQLEEAHLRLATTRSRLATVGEKLLYTSNGVQPPRGLTAKPQLTIFRNPREAASRSIAAEDATEMQPGDVLEVVVPVELNSAPPH